ncbi:unnamed protein product [Meganyctiphanes norvegica]|uniref:Apple domain-containing protein n=1 Tax=Meganyctiphanes norvegica TaxID=48144 RepID=A0AAV2RRQ6_MEGNR
MYTSKKMIPKYMAYGLFISLLKINLVTSREMDLRPLHGNVFKADGVALQPDDAYHKIATMNKCSCKWMCFTSGRCASWSVSPEPSGNPHLWECRLSTLGPLNLTLSTDTQGTYYFFKDTVPAKYKARKDDLLYLEPDFKLDWTSAKAWCEKLPGHRLAIFKTRTQGNLLIHIQKALNVGRLTFDLQQVSNGKAWGDGTPYDGSDTDKHLEAQGVKVYDSTDPINDIYYLALSVDQNELYLWDGQKDYPYWFICQANPLGIDW